MDLLNVGYVGGAIALAVGFYLTTPLPIRFCQRFQAHPQMEQLHFDDLDEETAGFLMNQAKLLIDVGFGEPTVIRLPSPVSSVNVNLIMLVNRETGDKAMITTIFGTPASLRTFYVEFSTRFESGKMFDTLNSSQLSSFPPTPNSIRTQVPTLSDPVELYRLHIFVIKQQQVREKTVVYEPGQALDYLTRKVLKESYDEQVLRGLLFYHEKSATYRPTLQGAYWMTWGLMQPFKWIRTLRMRRDARRVLGEFYWSTDV